MLVMNCHEPTYLELHPFSLSQYSSKLQLVDATKDQHRRKNGQGGANDPPGIEAHIWIVAIHQVKQGHDEGDAAQQHETFRKVHIGEFFLFPWTVKMWKNNKWQRCKGQCVRYWTYLHAIKVIFRDEAAPKINKLQPTQYVNICKPNIFLLFNVLSLFQPLPIFTASARHLFQLLLLFQFCLSFLCLQLLQVLLLLDLLHVLLSLLSILLHISTNAWFHMLQQKKCWSSQSRKIIIIKKKHKSIQQSGFGMFWFLGLTTWDGTTICWSQSPWFPPGPHLHPRAARS